MKPTIKPIFAMCFCSTKLVANARAFGGVEIGSTMALDAAIATPINTVGVPPIGANLSPIAAQTKAKIGINKAAVAELEIKLDNP